nr:DUF1223 domain-containing protein [Micromonospora sp. 4G55]
MTDPSLTGSNSARPQSSPQERDVGPAGGGFAVVEMFTSQGCNSCPPAEELLTEIEREARTEGQPVYAIGFHVDYWDDLGWPTRSPTRRTPRGSGRTRTHSAPGGCTRRR